MYCTTDEYNLFSTIYKVFNWKCSKLATQKSPADMLNIYIWTHVEKRISVRQTNSFLDRSCTIFILNQNHQEESQETQFPT